MRISACLLNSHIFGWSIVILITPISHLHLMTSDDLICLLTSHDVWNAFSVHGTSKIHFWKFALDDLWWPWPYFDPPWCLNVLFPISSRPGPLLWTGRLGMVGKLVRMIGKLVLRPSRLVSRPLPTRSMISKPSVREGGSQSVSQSVSHSFTDWWVVDWVGGWMVFKDPQLWSRC